MLTSSYDTVLPTEFKKKTEKNNGQYYKSAFNLTKVYSSFKIYPETMKKSVRKLRKARVIF